MERAIGKGDCRKQEGGGTQGSNVQNRLVGRKPFVLHTDTTLFCGPLAGACVVFRSPSLAFLPHYFEFIIGFVFVSFVLSVHYRGGATLQYFSLLFVLFCFSSVLFCLALLTFLIACECMSCLWSIILNCGASWSCFSTRE